MIQFTTHRAILDWYRRPRGVSNQDLSNPERVRQRVPDEELKPLPGVVSMTKHRLTIELKSKALVEHFRKVVEEALADPALHEAKRNAIEETQRQLMTAIVEEAKNG